MSHRKRLFVFFDMDQTMISTTASPVSENDYNSTLSVIHNVPWVPHQHHHHNSSRSDGRSTVDPCSFSNGPSTSLRVDQTYLTASQPNTAQSTLQPQQCLSSARPRSIFLRPHLLPCLSSLQRMGIPWSIYTANHFCNAVIVQRLLRSLLWMGEQGSFRTLDGGGSAWAADYSMIVQQSRCTDASCDAMLIERFPRSTTAAQRPTAIDEVPLAESREMMPRMGRCGCGCEPIRVTTEAQSFQKPLLPWTPRHLHDQRLKVHHHDDVDDLSVPPLEFVPVLVEDNLSSFCRREFLTQRRGLLVDPFFHHHQEQSHDVVNLFEPAPFEEVTSKQPYRRSGGLDECGRSSSSSSVREGAEFGGGGGALWRALLQLDRHLRRFPLPLPSDENHDHPKKMENEALTEDDQQNEWNNIVDRFHCETNQWRRIEAHFDL